MVFRDVTKSRRLSNRLSWQANHDALTGLYNRREFENRLVEAIALAHDGDNSHALCFLDLDKFKIVNDTCGHLAGDKLLQQVTNLLLQQVRSSDILARLGGDEFGLLLDRCPLSIAARIANNLRQSIEDFRFSWQGQTFSIGVSIGLVEITSDTDLNKAMNTADAACYIAKDNGRNCIHVCHNNDAELSGNLGRRQWIIRLDRALEANRFRLYTQKIIAIESQSPKHQSDRYEVLLRLQDEAGKLILPSAFMTAAERYNLMPAIDCWVIGNFLASYYSYARKNFDTQISGNRLYAINLSGASINSKQFLPFLQEQLDRYHIDPATICFEITETTAIANLAIASQFFPAIRQIGCSIAIDDFGSDISSLTYLENLPVDYLKIDGSLIQNIASSRVALATVEYLDRIAKIMEIKTVAKSVENDLIPIPKSNKRLRRLG